MSVFSRFFRFRIFKSRNNLSEELDDLHAETIHLQESLIQTRSLQQRWTKTFAIYAFLLYFILNGVYYVFFLPNDNAQRVYALLISLSTAVLFYAFHWILRWYFRTILKMKEEKIVLFKERRQELIEEVKTKETYAVAKSLLEKYGEKMTGEIKSPVINNELQSRPSLKPLDFNVETRNILPSTTKLIENENPTAMRVAASVTPGKLPRAILPAQRTLWGIFLDTIVGDGPSKRYALICKSCSNHNGMALDEEFQYLSFRCAYCNSLNGARKEKPVFNANLFSSNENLPERKMSDSNEGTKLVRRSICLGNRSNSNSPEQQRKSSYPSLSSSQENFSFEKRKSQ